MTTNYATKPIAMPDTSDIKANITALVEFIARAAVKYHKGLALLENPKLSYTADDRAVTCKEVNAELFLCSLVWYSLHDDVSRKFPTLFIYPSGILRSLYLRTYRPENENKLRKGTQMVYDAFVTRFNTILTQYDSDKEFAEWVNTSVIPAYVSAWTEVNVDRKRGTEVFSYGCRAPYITCLRNMIADIMSGEYPTDYSNIRGIDTDDWLEHVSRSRKLREAAKRAVVPVAETNITTERGILEYKDTLTSPPEYVYIELPPVVRASKPESSKDTLRQILAELKEVKSLIKAITEQE